MGLCSEKTVAVNVGGIVCCKPQSISRLHLSPLHIACSLKCSKYAKVPMCIVHTNVYITMVQSHI